MTTTSTSHYLPNMPTSQPTPHPSTPPSRKHALTDLTLDDIALTALALFANLPNLDYSSSQLLGMNQSPTEPLSTPDQDNTTRNLKNERDRPMIVFFYPADGTPKYTTKTYTFHDT
jgi:Peroxiredoxin